MSESTRTRAKRTLLEKVYDGVKSVTGINRPFQGIAELMHPSSRHRNWNESFYFNFFDPDENIGGWTRMGFLPNQEHDHGVMVVYWKGQQTLCFFSRERGSSAGGELALGELRYLCREPAQTWKVAFEGDLVELSEVDVIGIDTASRRERKRAEVSLLFEGMSPPYDVRNIDSALLADMLVESGSTFADAMRSRKVSHKHYEQAGKVTGVINIDGKETSFAGGGHRDHSWGVRDWTAPNYWNFSTCRFGDDMSFSLSRVSLGNMVLRFGFVVENGVNHEIRKGLIDVTGGEGPCDQKVSLSMAYSENLASVSGTALRITPIVFETDGHQTLIKESLMEYRWKDRVALGIFESRSAD